MKLCEKQNVDVFFCMSCKANINIQYNGCIRLKKLGCPVCLHMLTKQISLQNDPDGNV